MFSKRLLVIVGVCLASLWPATATSDPLRLRGDALAQSHSPVGLLVLEGADKTSPWMVAETMVWLGTGGQEQFDALTITLRLRDPQRRGELRLGRLVLATGAVRPVHMDGVVGLARLPRGFTIEGFGGLPVVPGFGPREADWLVGSRVAKTFPEIGTVGLTVLHQRDAGVTSNQEVGVDATSTPTAWLDLTARATYDLASEPGFSEVRFATTARRRAFRVGLFLAQRSPSRLLPATSLFSVLGDVPSREVGTTTWWRAAPRLDVRFAGLLRSIDDDLGADVTVRTTLRLNERGTRLLGGEVRRFHIASSGWTGVRTTTSYPISQRWSTGAELELVKPDEPDDRGSLWPWGLLALRWQPLDEWETAAAVEASASPEVRREVTLLARVTWRGGR